MYLKKRQILRKLYDAHFHSWISLLEVKRHQIQKKWYSEV